MGKATVKKARMMLLPAEKRVKPMAQVYRIISL